MSNLRPTVIDLFAGVGGLSLGFEQAGFDVVAAVEIDPIHAAAHKYNFPECQILPCSVENVTGQDILKATGGRPIDVIIGGAPCQGFSLIGQRALDDPRNSLVKEYIRLIIETKPKYFVFENVKGLIMGKHRIFLEEMMSALTIAGYTVTKPWKILNAKEYGVPQSRERLFLLGSLGAKNPPVYPENKNYSVTCEDALDDIPNAEAFRELSQTDSVEIEVIPAHSSYCAEMRCESRNSWHYSYKRIWRKTLLTSSLRTNHTPTSRRRFANTESGQVEPVSRFFKLDRNGVCNTLRAGTDAARGAFTSPRPIHYKYPRCVTVREMARLHGFPDWFRFHATKWHGARQIGNAVPPPLARAIGESIIQSLGAKPVKPRKKIVLGNARLLQMDMSQASKFWGVPNPIGKRNRKNEPKRWHQADTQDLKDQQIYA